jgi:uncharacterized oligopeptide transporter (OPT) family protein
VLELFNNEEVTRKSVRNTAIRIIVMIASLSLTCGYLVGCVKSWLSVISGIAIFLVLLFTVFEYISETKEVYLRWSKISKFCWVAVILTVVAILIMKLYLR